VPDPQQPALTPTGLARESAPLANLLGNVSHLNLISVFGIAVMMYGVMR
jgi:hypothetical protein